MSTIEIPSLTEAISADAPCGPALDNDPLFIELRIAAQGKPERRSGDSVIAAEEPDWAFVRNRSRELLHRSKDLRLAVHYTRASTMLEGFAGFREGLATIHTLVSEFWDGLHPALEGSDATWRINVLNELGSWDGMLRRLREIPLVRSRSGTITIKDLQAAEKVAASSSDEAATAYNAVRGILATADIDEVRGVMETLSDALQRTTAISNVAGSGESSGRGVEFDALNQALSGARRFLSESQGAGEVIDPSDVTTDGDSTIAVSTGAPERTPQGGPARSLNGAVTNREEALRALDLVSAYFAKHEPSSPIPLLLARAKRLVAKDFLTIMEELAPSGLNEVRSAGGIKNEG